MTIFETGTNEWQSYPSWPVAGVKPTPLYLKPDLGLDLEPQAGAASSIGYVSDPAKPVPYRACPIQPIGYTACQQWACWLVDDQCESSGRPDVLAFSSLVLTAPRCSDSPSCTFAPPPPAAAPIGW